VGRTSSITGSVTIVKRDEPHRVEGGLQRRHDDRRDDKQMRDNRLRNQGIETDTFTTSTFSLTQPRHAAAGATSGAAVDVTLHGDLTLHRGHEDRRHSGQGPALNGT